MKSIPNAVGTKSASEWRMSLDRRAARALRTRTLKMRNRRPLASITFDDCPVSAIANGAGILESHGQRGTFYICGALAGRDWENGRQFTSVDLQRLADAGHEIGCHTFSHTRCSGVSRADLELQIAANQAFVTDAIGDYVLSTFAYPYGTVGVASKRLLQSRFAACRGIEPGVDSGTLDLGLVKSNIIPAEAATADWLQPLIAETVARTGWLTLFTHDVTDNPTPFGCRPAALAAAIEALLAAGIEILPVKNALGRVAFDGS